MPINLSIHGFIGEDYPSDFVISIPISQDTENIVLPIGSFVNTLLEQSSINNSYTPIRIED